MAMGLWFVNGRSYQKGLEFTNFLSQMRRPDWRINKVIKMTCFCLGFEVDFNRYSIKRYPVYIYIITLVNVKAPEVTYNALVSALFRTGAGEKPIPTVIIKFV